LSRKIKLSGEIPDSLEKKREGGGGGKPLPERNIRRGHSLPKREGGL